MIGAYGSSRTGEIAAGVNLLATTESIVHEVINLAVK